MATVRRATLADADAIGRVHVRAWQAAFRGVVPDEVLDELDPAQRAQRWREWLLDPPTDQELLVAVDAGAVVGFALVGPLRGGASEVGEPEDGELYAINLTPEAWGRGTGSALLTRAEAQLLARGYRTLWLWIARDNQRARAFYERHGWVTAGEVRTGGLVGSSVEEVAYTRSPPSTPFD